MHRTFLSAVGAMGLPFDRLQGALVIGTDAAQVLVVGT